MDESHRLEELGPVWALLESLADAVLVCDDEGRVLAQNAAARALLGPLERLGPELGDRLADTMRQAIADDRSVALGDVEIAGRVHELVVAPLHGRAAVVVRDVDLPRRLTTMTRQTARLDSLAQLAAGIAHDFNNALNGIIGAAELLSLQTVPPGSPGAENVEMILDTAEQAAELTRELLSLSRTSARAVAKLDAHELIREAVAVLRHSIDKRVEISLALAAERATIEGDRAQLHGALLQLGLNAKQAMPEGGRLEIRTAIVELDGAADRDLDPGAYLEIRVDDTGVGIDPALLPRIFTPFFTTHEPGRGAGIGLALVQGAVESHHGAITISGEPGVGTRVRLLLPLERVEAEQRPADEQSSPPKPMKVLIADDESGVRRTLATYFTMQGGEVLEAADGEEALALIEQHHTELDLVVLDTVMPKLGGADCLRALRKLAPTLPVVMTSGYLKDVALRDLEDLGIGAFLSKPFRLAQLGEAVARAVNMPARAVDMPGEPR